MQALPFLFASTQLAPPFSERASCAPAAISHTRVALPNRTALTSPSGSDPLQSGNAVLFFDTGMPEIAVQFAPLLVERRTWPPLPTARPVAPLNSMSLSGIALGP